MLVLLLAVDMALPCMQGVPPAPRRGHTAAMVSNRNLLLHGGFDGQKHLGDAFVLDTASCTWSRLELLGGPEQVPSARAFHTMVWLGHAALLLGGSGKRAACARCAHRHLPAGHATAMLPPLILCSSFAITSSS